MNNYINTYTDDTVNSNKPSVSYYKSLGKLVYSKDYRCTTNKSEAKPGDIVLSLPTSNNFNYFVSPDYYNVNASRISGSTYYPMGVVVVPSSHTEDSTVRIVSIKYMDYNNPVDGSDKPVEIYWGYKTDLSLTNLGLMITAVPGTSTTSTDTSSYTPTNYHKVKYLANTTDPGTSWHGSSSSSPSPSPYTATGTKSTVYHTSGQALADMDGKTNTDTIIAATTANWYSGSNDNSEKVVNSSNTGNYPAACCCRRYSCKNASLNFRTGNWYLPSVGELGYLVARFEEIDRSRRMLGSKSMFDTKLFSSTEYNLSGAWMLYLNSYYFGRFDFGSKNSTNDSSVVAFCSI